MQLSTALLAGIVIAILVLLTGIALRYHKGKAPTHRTAASPGPSNLRYTCKGCSELLTHSKRTIGAYEKGARSFFCNSCHSKWRESNPGQPMAPQKLAKLAPSIGSSNDDRSSSNSGVRSGLNRDLGQSQVKSGSGCLGATLLIVAVPIILIAMAAKYA